jgi:ABC-type nitrate/sulfonate/bicarbonate transport system substrate-binding protein
MAYITNEPVLLKSEGFTPVALSFADNGMELFTDCFIVTQDSIKNNRDMLKALLKAEIQGWTAAIADPAGSARLAANVYGKDQKLQVREQTQEATIQNGLIATADTKKNGLFTMTDALVGQTIDSLGAMGTKVSASQLVDLSLLTEVYQENPSLITA